MAKHLDVPCVSQPKGSTECGIASAKMIADRFGMRMSYDAIKAELPLRGDWGLYIFEIGSFFLKHGAKAEIVSQNTRYLGVDQENVSTQEIRDHIEKLKPRTKTDPHMMAMADGFNTLTDFIDNGGKFTARIPTPHMIEQEINRKRPVLAAITTRFLYPGLHVKHNEHFAVITGYDHKDFVFNDPASYLKGVPQKFAKNKVMYGIYANTYPTAEGGSILKLKL